MARPIDQVREAARVAGDTRYISAKPCPKGHVGERFVISTACCACGDVRRVERKGKPIMKRSPKENRAQDIEAAKARFNRPAFGRALADYRNSEEAHRHSKYLNDRIKLNAQKN
jgi:hypothetical protein